MMRDRHLILKNELRGAEIFEAMKNHALLKNKRSERVNKLLGTIGAKYSTCIDLRVEIDGESIPLRIKDMTAILEVYEVAESKGVSK